MSGIVVQEVRTSGHRVFLQELVLVNGFILSYCGMSFSIIISWFNRGTIGTYLVLAFAVSFKCTGFHPMHPYSYFTTIFARSWISDQFFGVFTVSSLIVYGFDRILNWEYLISYSFVRFLNLEYLCIGTSSLKLILIFVRWSGY